MATYFIAAEHTSPYGTASKVNAIVKDFDIDPHDDSFIKALTAKIAAAYGFDASRTFIFTCTPLGACACGDYQRSPR